MGVSLDCGRICSGVVDVEMISVGALVATAEIGEAESC